MIYYPSKLNIENMSTATAAAALSALSIDNIVMLPKLSVNLTDMRYIQL